MDSESSTICFPAAMTRLAAETVSKTPACARKAGIQPDTIPIPKTKSTSNAGTTRLILRISGCLQRQPEILFGGLTALGLKPTTRNGNSCRCWQCPVSTACQNPKSSLKSRTGFRPKPLPSWRATAKSSLKRHPNRFRLLLSACFYCFSIDITILSPSSRPPVNLMISATALAISSSLGSWPFFSSLAISRISFLSMLARAL